MEHEEFPIDFEGGVVHEDGVQADDRQKYYLVSERPLFHKIIPIPF